MTRAEADVLVQEYDDEVRTWVADSRLLGGLPGMRDTLTAAFHKMNAVRERLIDRLCGEEPTQPLAGSAT